MFQCKDLLSLTTMSQADVIAGSGGMEKGIRWSYKAENINKCSGNTEKKF